MSPTRSYVIYLSKLDEKARELEVAHAASILRQSSGHMFQPSPRNQFRVQALRGARDPIHYTPGFSSSSKHKPYYF